MSLSLKVVYNYLVRDATRKLDSAYNFSDAHEKARRVRAGWEVWDNVSV
jgi:hypothetical protein